MIETFLLKLKRLIKEKTRRRYLQNLIAKGLKLGKNVAIIDDFFFDPSHCYLISIGDNCTICPNVKLIAHDASTKRILGYTKIGKIEIRDNCFIGDSAIILPGVTIGPNSIVGAGSVVTEDVPPNTVVAGNPAKIICSLEEYVNKVEQMKKGKKVFGKEYLIDNLNQEKLDELLKSVSNSIGFIK